MKIFLLHHFPFPRGVRYSRGGYVKMGIVAEIINVFIIFDRSNPTGEWEREREFCTLMSVITDMHQDVVLWRNKFWKPLSVWTAVKLPSPLSLTDNESTAGSIDNLSESILFRNLNKPSSRKNLVVPVQGGQNRNYELLGTLFNIVFRSLLKCPADIVFRSVLNIWDCF